MYKYYVYKDGKLFRIVMAKDIEQAIYKAKSNVYMDDNESSVYTAIKQEDS